MADWLAFNVLLALAPALLVWVYLWMANAADRSIFLIIRDGQLCFYCTALSATTLHDLTKLQGSPSIGLPFAGLVIFMVFTTFVYGVAVVADNLSTGVIEDWKLGVISIGAAFTITLLVVYTRWQFAMF